MKKVELLAPARDLEAGLAAVECGADAVYVGGPGFGARSAAGNSVDDIAALVRRAHLFGVRVYATLNTLLMDDELADAAAVAQSLLDVGVDALIVQDMAWLRMGLRARGGSGEAADGSAPEFHASTQTAAMTPERVRFLAAAGFSRVVLERAMSLDEIRAVAASISAPPAPPRAGADDFPREVELETFVHGAICVGFSGHCYLSRAMPLRQAQGGAGGQRSGNRGTCSQPCRLTWDLVERSPDGSERVSVRGKHLLSVRDLDLSARLGELIDAGVTSLKIEGRLKDANYVRNVVSHYNLLLRELGVARTSAGRSVPDFVPNPLKSFTRGASEWFLDGALRQARDGARGGVATFDSPKSVGEYIGTVDKIACDRTGGWWITLDGGVAELASGDGICFDAGSDLRGTNVNRVAGGRVYLNDHQGVTVGSEIYRNYDHAFNRALERSRTRRRISVRAEVATSPRSVSVRFVDETGITVTVSREGDFAPARDPEKMRSVMAAELSRSGDTIFAVTAATSRSGTAAPRAHGATEPSYAQLSSRARPQADEGSPFIPVSVVAALRREGLEKLLAERQRLVPERHPAAENLAARLPKTRVGAAKGKGEGYGEGAVGAAQHLGAQAAFGLSDDVEQQVGQGEKLGGVVGAVGATENVTNRLAERFYRDHGAVDFAPQLELAPDLTGAVVMRSRYCLRREMGLCGASGLHGTPVGELFLVHGAARFRVENDCAKCEMRLRPHRDGKNAHASISENG